MAYVTYNNFKLGNTAVSGYQSIISGETVTALQNLQAQCEKQEKNFYYSKYGKKKGLPANWKELVKKEVAGPQVKSGLSVKKIAANAYLQATNYDDFKTSLLAGFKDAYVGQLSLFEPDEISKTLDHSIARLYKTLTTRLKNDTIKITKTTISGPKSSTIEGWLVEIMQGSLDRKKLSTAGSTKYSVVADYIVEGVGLEETKRGLDAQDPILQSTFHVGSFTTTSMMKGKNWSELQKLLSEIFISIMTELSLNNSLNIRTLRRRVFDNLNLLIAGYLTARLTYGLEGNKEIFYFGSGSTVLLGSEFIEGVLVHSKLSSAGYAELSSKIGYTQLSHLGLEALIEELRGTSMQLGMNFSDKRTKSRIEVEIQKSGLKLGPYFKKGRFDLWYGK
jgi:hypothetical protein